MLRFRVQTIFAMIRQCSTLQLTHPLRTCQPTTIRHATRRLDTAVPIPSSNTEEIREAAYVSVLLQCAPAMYQFGISSGAAVGGATGISSGPAVSSLRMKEVLCLNGISSHTIWKSPPQLRMQKLITSQLQALRRGAAHVSLPTGLCNGPAVQQPLTPNDSSSTSRHYQPYFPGKQSAAYC